MSKPGQKSEQSSAASTDHSELARGLSATNVVTLGLGAGSIGILLFFQFGLKDLLQRVGVAKPLAIALPKSGPLVAVLVATLRRSA